MIVNGTCLRNGPIFGVKNGNLPMVGVSTIQAFHELIIKIEVNSLT
jgi:hypothetical protein